MAIVRWRGDAPAISQVVRATPANVEVGDVFQLSIGGKLVAYTAAAATVADVCAGLAAAWNASPVAEHAEVTAADMTSYVQLTGDRPGTPFTLIASMANGGASNTQTLLLTTTRAASGPNDWNTAANWSTGAVPASGDDAHIESGSSSILYGLAQSGVSLASLSIAQSYTGAIGLARVNPAGYLEYRDSYLAIGAAQVNIGQGEGAGSGRIRLDTGAGATTLDIANSGAAAEAGSAAIDWLGSSAANVIHLARGSLSVAAGAGQTAAIGTLGVGYRGNPAGDATARIGAGVTLGALAQSGGQVFLSAGATSIHQQGGELRQLAGGVGTLQIDAGTLYYQSTGAIGVAHVGERGVLDFSRDLRARTVSECHLYGGARLLDPFATATFSTGIQLHRASLASVTLDLGVDRTLEVI